MNFHDVWGAIEYKGEGVFIAGGAGVTRSLQFLGNYKLKTKSQNKLILLIRPQTI
jgi:hypothetical protein